MKYIFIALAKWMGPKYAHLCPDPCPAPSASTIMRPCRPWVRRRGWGGTALEDFLDAASCMSQHTDPRPDSQDA